MENELVVKEVMPEALKLGYTLEKAIPGWKRRGVEGMLAPGAADALLRADQFEDDMEGFFVALFTRPTPPGAKKAAASAAAAAAVAEPATAVSKRGQTDGSDGVRAVYPSKKKRKKKGGKPAALFR